MRDQGRTNLELLDEIRKTLHSEQQRELIDYLVGALSATVSTEDWKACITSAQRCYAGNTYRRDAERAKERAS